MHYVLAIGRKSGIFNTSRECKANTSRYPNVLYQPLYTYGEALVYMQQIPHIYDRSRNNNGMCNNISETVDNKEKMKEMTLLLHQVAMMTATAIKKSRKIESYIQQVLKLFFGEIK